MANQDFSLLIFGLGYVGTAVASALGADVVATARTAPSDPPCRVIPIDRVPEALARATHLLLTAAPDDKGDPLIALVGLEALAAAPALRWIGYLSTTGVYGDRAGAWVDEATPPAPMTERARQRLAAETAFSRLADRRAVDLFRLAGIYGPRRSVFDTLRAGRGQRVIQPGHGFGRIHRDDIVRAVIAAMRQERAAGARVLNLADNEPAESAAVLTEAARLLAIPPPPEVPFAVAFEAMSPMARSFWAENRKVSSARTRRDLGIEWLYPTYREGLAATLRQEVGEDIA